MPLKAYLIFFVLILTAVSAAAQEKARYSLGLILAEDDKMNGNEILSAATDAFVATHRFTMVERQKLDAVFTEKDLQEFIGGKVNNKLSDFLGLDLLGIISFTVDTQHKPGEGPKTAWTINVRVVDVKTSAIVTTLTSERAFILPAPTAREAGRLLFESIREAFPPMGYVVQINGKKAIVDLGSDAGLKKGDSLEIVQEGEEIIHPVTGQVLAAPMKVIGELLVLSTSAQISTCKIKEMQGELRLGKLVRLRGRSSVILDRTFEPSIFRHVLGNKRAIFGQDPSVTLEVRSVTRPFALLDPTEHSTLELSWTAPPSHRSEVQLRASSVKPLTYLCMDATAPATRGSYRWPGDPLATRGLGLADLGVLAWIHLPGPEGTTRSIYLPLRIGKGTGETEDAGYRISFVPSERLNKVLLTVSRLDDKGDVVAVLRHDKELGYGYYPSGKPTSFLTGRLEANGFYRITVTAISESGLSVQQDIDLYHPGA